MRADDLDHALRIANGTPYGLTAGLHSLDEREQRRWSERMHAGNLYINRPVTGAIVQRQPFGGMKASSFGLGAKAGGPNYVLQTTRPLQRAAPAIMCAPVAVAAELAVRVRPRLNELQRERLGVGLCSYAHALNTVFACDHEPSRLLGERNLLRYLPCTAVWVRAAADADEVDLLLALGAAISSEVAYAVSLHPSFDARTGLGAELAQLGARIEGAAICAERLIGACAAPQPNAAALRPGGPGAAPERVRAIGTIELELSAAAADVHVHIEGSPVLLTGRVELLRYHREQSVSHRFHRYGNLAPERLLPPLRVPRAAG
jgi:RHH-type proline utilization regulon transcriptional repressor/proline dehydrogenase/delta 1-pyrroline-5-carboxylate dehydrogenase